MFEHVTLRVTDIEASRRFYETALAPLDVGEPVLGGHLFEWETSRRSRERLDM